MWYALARIYVETTIPSFYYEVRTEPEMIARRNWTRDWWAVALERDELVTGPPVIAELERGDFPGRQDALALIGRLPLLEITEPEERIGETSSADITPGIHKRFQQYRLVAITLLPVPADAQRR